MSELIPGITKGKGLYFFDDYGTNKIALSD